MSALLLTVLALPPAWRPSLCHLLWGCAPCPCQCLQAHGASPSPFHRYLPAHVPSSSPSVDAHLHMAPPPFRGCPPAHGPSTSPSMDAHGPFPSPFGECLPYLLSSGGFRTELSGKRKEGLQGPHSLRMIQVSTESAVECRATISAARAPWLLGNLDRATRSRGVCVRSILLWLLRAPWQLSPPKGC